MLESRARAPSLIGIPRRSTHGICDEARAMANAIEASRGIGEMLPVVFGNRVIGQLYSPLCRPEVYWTTNRRGYIAKPFTSEDNLIQAITKATPQRYTAFWAKSHETTTVARSWYDLWPVGGNPQLGAYGGAARTAVSKINTTAGALDLHTAPTAPGTKHITGFDAIPQTSGASSPVMFLYDRVLTYEACAFNANANATFTNTVPATRYISAGQSGMKICVTCETALGSTASNITQLRYTDQDGNTLQSMPTTPTVAVITSAAAPASTLGARVVAPATSGAVLTWGPFLPLAAGDGGARLINDWTTSAANTGTLCLVMARPLAVCPTTTGTNVTGAIGGITDTVQAITNLEQVYDDACLSFLLWQSATAGVTWYGGVDLAWSDA